MFLFQSAHLSLLLFFELYHFGPISSLCGMLFLRKGHTWILNRLFEDCFNRWRSLFLLHFAEPVFDVTEKFLIVSEFVPH